MVRGLRADLAVAVRNHDKSQPGCRMSLGSGMLQCKSNEQSTIENSSTMAEELIALSTHVLISMITWTTNILKSY